MLIYKLGWLADRLLFFTKAAFIVFTRWILKRRRNVRKIEIPINTPTQFELGNTTADIQRRREEREQREGGGGTETSEGGEGQGGSQEGGNYTVSREGNGGKATKN